MALPPQINSILAQLTNTFPITNGRSRDQLHRKLTTILKDYYPTNSDVATQERFERIEEKCRILNNNDLADALLVRFEKLIQWQISWKFDVLSLLQHLSDNPVYKTRLEDLDCAAPSPPSVDLTWNDILQDEPFDEPKIWRNIDYAASSSEESIGSLEDSQDGEQQDLLSESASETGVTTFPQSEIDQKGLKDIAAARKAFLSLESAGSIQMTETQLMRETLHMLHGIPSMIYDQKAGEISLRSSYTINNVSTGVIRYHLEAFTKVGTMLYHIRGVTEQHIKDPLLQSFQACLLEMLETFDLRLSSIERKIIGSYTSVYTLMTLSRDIELASRSLKLLAPLILSVPRQQYSFTLLDSLFGLVEERRSIGDFVSYESIGLVFFQCLNIYLRSVTIWLNEGTVDDGGAQFFVKRKHKNASIADLWYDQYQLDVDDQDQIRAPKFLWPSIRKIFAAGKGINLLRALNHDSTLYIEDDKSTLTFAIVCGNSSYELDSFEDLFEDAFDRWVRSKSSVSEAQVVAAVTQHGELKKMLAAIEYLFLSKDGALSQQFACNLFDCMDESNSYRLDGFWLTEACRDCFQHVADVDVTKISATCIEDPASHLRQKSMQRLSMIRVEYTVPWSLRIIIRPEHIQIFRDLSVLLLQLRYANYLLEYDKNSRLFPTDLDRQLILLLQQRFRWFANLLLSHLTLNVIDGAIKKLYEISETAQSLDALITLYDETIAHIERSCLISCSRQETLSAIVAMLDLVLQFSDLCTSICGSKSKLRSNHEDHDGDQSKDGYEQDPDIPRGTAPEDASHALKECLTRFDESLSLISSSIHDTIKLSGNASLQILLESIESGFSKR